MSAPTINKANAVLLVRKNLDEADPNGSVMYGDTQDETSDNNSLDDIIDKNLPEAINEIHKAAPVYLLEDTATEASFSSGSATATNFLRLIGSVDDTSGIALSSAFLESSPEAHKQANSYIAATADRPCLVQCLGGGASVKFKYYPSSANAKLHYVGAVTYSASGSYAYSSRLLQNIIDWLTAKVLETYGDQRAQSYYQRALTFH